MASSPADRGAAERGETARGGPDVAGGTVAFALRELTTCWDQALAALADGDLERVAALLDVAHDHVAAAVDTSRDGETEARLRAGAAAAFTRLEDGMRGGLDGLANELGRARAGGKALRGYGRASLRIGDHVARDA